MKADKSNKPKVVIKRKTGCKLCICKECRQGCWNGRVINREWDRTGKACEIRKRVQKFSCAMDDIGIEAIQIVKCSGFQKKYMNALPVPAEPIAEEEKYPEWYKNRPNIDLINIRLPGCYGTKR